MFFIHSGPILFRHITDVLPFGGAVDAVELQGKYILAMLEHSVSEYPTSGAFMQVAGQYEIQIQIQIYFPFSKYTKTAYDIYNGGMTTEEQSSMNVATLTQILGTSYNIETRGTL